MAESRGPCQHGSMANRETEQAIAAFFHLQRSLGKPRDRSGSERIYRAIVEINRREDMAARHRWEAGWG